MLTIYRGCLALWAVNLAPFHAHRPYAPFMRIVIAHDMRLTIIHSKPICNLITHGFKSAGQIVCIKPIAGRDPGQQNDARKRRPRLVDQCPGNRFLLSPDSFCAHHWMLSTVEPTASPERDDDRITCWHMRARLHCRSTASQGDSQGARKTDQVPPQARSCTRRRAATAMPSNGEEAEPLLYRP